MTSQDRGPAQSSQLQFPAFPVFASQELVRLGDIRDSRAGGVEEQSPASQPQGNRGQVEGIRDRSGQQEIPVGGLAAFERGVDGVIVAGCLEGGCHFQEGNLRARRRVERAKQILEEVGIEPERLEMFNLSSAEGPRFAEIVTLMSERIAKLGLSPLRLHRDHVELSIKELSEEAKLAIAGEKR